MTSRYRAAFTVFAVLAATQSLAQRKDYPDGFAVLNEINKASAVMVVEQGIVPRPLGG